MYICNICTKPIKKNDQVYKRKFIINKNRKNQYQHYSCYLREHKLWKFTILPSIGSFIFGIAFLFGAIYNLEAVNKGAWSGGNIAMLVIGIVTSLLFIILISSYFIGIYKIRDDQMSKNY